MTFSAAKSNVQSDDMFLAAENDESCHKLREEQDRHESMGKLSDLDS